MILWLLIFIIIVFMLLMFIITPYESEKTQQKVMIICGIVLNSIFVINTLLVLSFLLFTYYFNFKVLIGICIYSSMYVLLNILILKKGKIDLKKYLALCVLGIIIGLIIDGFIKSYLWMSLALL